MNLLLYFKKFTSINIGIYIINYIITSLFTLHVSLHIMGFITVIILLDAIITENDLKTLELKYNNLLKYNNVETDLNILKTKLDLLTSQINIHLLNNKSEINKIDINIKDEDFNYKLARNSLINSKSLSFKNSKKKEKEIPIINIGEVITLSVKK